MIQLDDLRSVNIDDIYPEEIISNFIEKEKKVLYINESKDSEKKLNFSENNEVSQKNIHQLENMDEKTFDYIVLTEILEIIDDPKSLIAKVKNLTEHVIIYEYKFDEGCYNNDNWNKPWTKIGLEHFLCKEFDFVNNIFLGYATIHICKYPNNITPSVIN